jgi:MFS family permease
MTPATDASRHAAESWFLRRGLPAALSPRARSRHLVSRSAPALAAYATVVVALLVVFFLTGSSEIYIDGPPTPAEQIVLAVIALAVPVAVLVGWLVSRLHNRRAQAAASIVSVLLAVVAAGIQGGWSHLLATAVVVAIVAALTASGVGAVLGWAVRLSMTQAAAMGALFVRALPVVLLTVVVFLNTYAWVLASTISRTRLWVALLLLVVVTTAFIVSASRARVAAMLESVSAPHDGVHGLSGTPFAAMPDSSVDDPLTMSERVNVAVVLAAAQVAHLMMVAISTAAIYLALGLIVLSPALLAKWTGGGASDGTVLGMTIPVPQSLIHMTLILATLTFMYVSARSVGDDDYKRDVLAPLVEDLHVTLLGRKRFRGEQRTAR